MSKPSARPSKIKTQDEPLNLDAVERESADKQFRFILGDREWVMTPLGRLERKAAKKIARMSNAGDGAELEFIDEMFKLAMGEEQFAEFDQLPLSQASAELLFETWSENSGIEIPESPASTDS